MKVAARGSFGLPSKKVQTPEISQHLKTFADFKRNLQFPGYRKKLEELGGVELKELKPYLNQVAKGLKTKGVKVDDFHSLDDVEFYSQLSTEVNRFERNADRDLPMNERILDYISGTHFFQALARGSTGKWKKAVREFTKAVS